MFTDKCHAIAGKLEREAIERILFDRGLVIHSILPDGDCLYSALAHQLSLISASQVINIMHIKNDDKNLCFQFILYKSQFFRCIAEIFLQH